MSDERELPKTRLGRLTKLARVGARTGGMLLGGDANAAAERAAELLGELRGLAAKVGQMASFVDGFFPERHGETFARALASLQADTARSPFSEVRALVEQELGAALSDRFARFDAEPIASASIGQVHRAALFDGREVVVKVQHAGIREALEADLSGAGAVASLVSALAPKAVAADAIYQEVAARFREELDYKLEAQRQERFHRLFAEDAGVHIPAVIPTHSTQRVLTAEFCVGEPFSAAVTKPVELRRRYAEVLWRFVFSSILRHGAFNADPHPGNYLFHDDGRVTFLDFGCIQELSPSYRGAIQEMHRAAMTLDKARFHTAARAGLGTLPGKYEEVLVDYLFRCFEPLTRSPYRMERTYVADIVRSTQSLKTHTLKSRSRPTRIPEGVALLNRLQFGFYSVLARLDVEVDYAAIDRAILDCAAASGLHLDTPA